MVILKKLNHRIGSGAKKKKKYPIPRVRCVFGLKSSHTEDYPFVPIGDVLKKRIKNTDGILKKWLEEEQEYTV